jgi:hypothetical protein
MCERAIVVRAEPATLLSSRSLKGSSKYVSLDLDQLIHYLIGIE